MIVADASVLVTALLDEGAFGALAREHLAAADIHVPALADVEVLSAARRQVLAGHIPPSRGTALLRDYADLVLVRHDHLALLPRAWALRDAVSGYDAQYVVLAEILRATLVTADARLGRAPGLRCQVDVLA